MRNYIISVLISAITLLILIFLGVPSRDPLGYYTFFLIYPLSGFVLTYLLITVIKGFINPGINEEGFTEVLKRVAENNFKSKFIVGLILWIVIVFPASFSFYWGNEFSFEEIPYVLYFLLLIISSSVFLLVHVAWNYLRVRGRLIIISSFIVFLVIQFYLLMHPTDYITLDLPEIDWFYVHTTLINLLFPFVMYWLIIKDNNKLSWGTMIFIISNAVFFSIRVLLP